MRVDPAYLQQLTGLTGFNCAVSSGSIADTWVFIHLVHDRFPDSTQHYLWLVDAEQFAPSGCTTRSSRTLSSRRMFRLPSTT